MHCTLSQINSNRFCIDCKNPKHCKLSIKIYRVCIHYYPNMLLYCMKCKLLQHCKLSKNRNIFSNCCLTNSTHLCIECNPLKNCKFRKDPNSLHIAFEHLNRIPLCNQCIILHSNTLNNSPCITRTNYCSHKSHPHTYRNRLNYCNLSNENRCMHCNY